MAHDVELPEGFVFEEYFIDGLAQPTDLKVAPDGRIFIAEKGGAIRIVENGTLLDQPFYTVTTQSPNERGLVGIALDPNFEINGFVYMMYTLPLDNQNIVARVTSAGNTAIPGSEIELIRFDRMWAAFHNGGAMVFDTEGKLIIGTGDGTGYTSAQDMNSTLGKIIRINTDGTIPTDNPFYNENDSVYRAIAAIGIRNPYTMAASPSTGRIFFNDVGNIDYEEVNEYIIGSNYGWYPIEGMLNGAPAPEGNYLDPIYAYDHDFGCAVVGASFYEPEIQQFPDGYFGKYFFLDLCKGKLLFMDPNSYEVVEFATGLKEAYNNLEVGPDGYLYLVNVIDGNMARISYVGVNSPPHISEHPASQVVAVGEDIRFQVEASGEELEYRWFRNGNQIPSQQGASLILTNVQLSDHGSEFSVTVSNPNGSITSNIASLTVVDGSRPSISFQNVPATYEAGDTIPFSALVSDPDQQDMPPQSLTWEIKFHHDDHAHPAMPPTTGIHTGEYIVEKYGEVDTNVFFRIHLTAEDSSGLTTTDFIDVQPEKVTMLLTTEPEGIAINADGSDVITNFPLRSVKSLNRTLKASPHMVVGDSLYQFVQWEDGQDSLLRVFEAQEDTIAIEYQSVEAYSASIPSIGNLNLYLDTGAVRTYYGSKEVAEINENWDVLHPYPQDTNPPFPSDYYSGQWTGAIHPPVTGAYTFYLYHDGKVSFYLDGVPLLENSLSAHDTQEDTIQVWLDRGANVDLRLEYDHHEYIARVELDWSFSIIGRHTVPFSKNYPKDNLEEDDDGVVLFPNPTREPIIYVYINPEVYGETPIHLLLFDSNGRLHQSFGAELENGIYPLSVSSLPSGMYFLRITYGSREKTMKFIKD